MKRLIFICLLLSVGSAFAQGQSVLPPRENIRMPDFTISNANAATSGIIDCDLDGKLLAAAGDNIIQVYKVQGEDRLNAKLTRTLTSTSPIQGISFGPSKELVALSTDGIVRTWSVVSTRMFYHMPLKSGQLAISAFAPNYHPLLAAGTRNRVMLWNYQNGKLLRTFEANDSNVSTLALTPDGKLLVIGTIKGVIRVLDVATWKVTRSVDLDSPIHALAASAGRIVVGYSDGTVAMVDFGDRSSIQELEAHKQAVSAVAFSPSGDRFASGSVDGSVKIWNTETLKPICTLEGNTAKVLALLFSPDGRNVVASGADGKVNEWRLPPQ